MEKDPHTVARLAAERKEENWRFRSFLKRQSLRRTREIDRLAAQFGREAEAQMDCTTCGACCRSCHVPVDEAEVERLAARLNLPVSSFREQHMDPLDDDEPALRAPCVFLEGNRCGIYEDRPEACRGYPYIGGNIASRMIAIIERAETCPIVFEMLERLKEASGFHRYR
ncbi:MAG TPA: YkgJ family cysteine cluster protein [Phycisphaerae bacterium]|jgi:Fe-S-cluster containining protein|nr:YkgJ family cysteine cluster protein [Phycisphaerae bacterium]HOB73228.1 YkgJ family cysteine cluster protein [Phycisphaerae bacterium]HOJ54862.1 YkgJ family cysteine cluster protein [Phycisphaerae bacterium]HOL26048.1 YkgJ family cysteine cluster protein [Phycisphaerae bacterium]HPP21502.1 YkgJ family cysteine cluster protein [Phycisphaerae bacterium]